MRLLELPWKNINALAPSCQFELQTFHYFIHIEFLTNVLVHFHNIITLKVTCLQGHFLNLKRFKRDCHTRVARYAVQATVPILIGFCVDYH